MYSVNPENEKQQYLQWTEFDEHVVMKRVPKKPHYFWVGLNDLMFFFNGNFILIFL